MKKLELWELMAESGKNDENAKIVDGFGVDICVGVESPVDTAAALAGDGASLLCSSNS